MCIIDLGLYTEITEHNDKIHDSFLNGQKTITYCLMSRNEQHLT